MGGKITTLKSAGVDTNLAMYLWNVKTRGLSFFQKSVITGLLSIVVVLQAVFLYKCVELLFVSF